MLKRTMFALTAAAMLLPASAGAQESATLTLRSGEKVSGQLVDHGASGFAIRTNGQSRQIPTSQVAVIDFGGGGDVSAEDFAKVSSGSATVWRQVTFPANGPVQLTSRSVSIAFDPERGTVTPTTTFKLKATAGKTVHQIVNIMGRVRSCSPDNAPGVRAC